MVALALQVAVNYANDYSDGTPRHRRRPGRPDAAGRLGRRRRRGRCWSRRGSRSPSPRVAGLALAALSSWWLVAVGAVCIAAAWTYTGGPLPYGYRALGEVFVFVFFGLVAVVGTTYVQTGTLPGLAFAVAVPIGPADRGDPGGQQPARHRRATPLVGKRTLAVLLGERATRLAFVGLFVVAFAVVAAVGRRPPLGAARRCSPPRWRCRPRARCSTGGRGPALIGALQGTGRLTLVTGVLLGRRARAQRLSRSGGCRSPLSRVRRSSFAARRARLRATSASFSRSRERRSSK